NGSGTGSDPITYRYQWYRCDAQGSHCLSVRGATAQGYRLAATDAGKTIGLTVTATDTTGKSQPAYAALAGPVVTTTLASTAQPAVSAKDQTFTVDAGTWTAAPASTT